jgi:hypothetical protein
MTDFGAIVKCRKMPPPLNTVSAGVSAAFTARIGTARIGTARIGRVRA